MTDAEPAGRTTKAAIGDERNGLAHASAHDGTRDTEHLAHTRTTDRALVANHDHIAIVDLAVDYGVHRSLFATEDAGGAAELANAGRGDLDDATARRSRATQDEQATIGMDRIRERVHDRAVRVRSVGESLGHRLTCDRQLVTVQEARVEQLLEDRRHATNLVEIGHHVLATRLEVGNVWRHLGNSIEIVELELDVGLVRDREQMQDGIRRATRGVDRHDRVLEGLLGHDPARVQLELDGLDSKLAGLDSPFAAPHVRGGSRRGTNRRHAKGLGNRGHRVGSKHATARAGAWAGLFLQLVQVFLAHRAARHCTDRLEDVLNVDVFATELAGHDRAAIEEAARQVEARRAHQHAGQALVAASDRDRAVEALGVHDQLVRVSDILARDE